MTDKFEGCVVREMRRLDELMKNLHLAAKVCLSLSTAVGSFYFLAKGAAIPATIVPHIIVSHVSYTHLSVCSKEQRGLHAASSLL